jgi:hypothetical protein
MKTISTLSKLCILIMGLSLLLLSSCNEDEFPDASLLPKGLEGSWVEVNTLADTIIFNSNSDEGLFWLQRGYEIRDGYRLPIIGSTGYEYKIISDSITLVDGLSSTWNEETYYFNYNEPNLTIKIGKFSSYIETSKSTLTFRKIK